MIPTAAARMRSGVSAVQVGAGGAAILALLVAGACGENLFPDPTGFASSDRTGPAVRILAPEPDFRVPIGDSVLVHVEIEDHTGIEAIEFAGFAVRGDVALGTDERIDRFLIEAVAFPNVQVRDTTISRYLVATNDSIAEDRAYLSVAAVDRGGNVRADTIPIRIGGPRIQIVSPRTGSTVRAGTDLRVRLSAGDPEHRFHTISLAAGGGVSHATELRFEPPRAALDTVIDIAVPSSPASGEIRLNASVRNTVNDSTATATVILDVLPPVADTRPPTLRFVPIVPARAERADSVSITVVSSDETRTGRVGVNILAVHRLPEGPRPLAITSAVEFADSATFNISLEEIGVAVPTDTSTLILEVTAFAYDAAGNCATATIPKSVLAESCDRSEPPAGPRPGARYELMVVRGRTVPLASSADHIADLVADASHVYLSNMGRNRLEVLPIGGVAFSDPIPVGSRPWGLAFNRDRSRLYVANSGGTNISVVSPRASTEARRISMPNVKLFDVAFEVEQIPLPGADSSETPDSVERYVPSTVTAYDYSDRPQYIGVTRSENLVFSTQPTTTVDHGTVRIFDLDRDRLEFVTDYVENTRTANQVVIVNADSAFLRAGDPNHIRVCPRPRSTDPAIDGSLAKECFTDLLDVVEKRITQAGYDTRFLYGVDISEIGLSDTTFVAVSGDHRTVAIGEGARQNGRVITMTEADWGGDSTIFFRHGEVQDLVGNTGERLAGLALNADGSLGIGRGSETFFFSRDLRLAGVAESDPNSGAAAMHPDNPAVDRAFVAGITADGIAFIDVMDTFHFRRLRRIFLRDPVTGPIRAVRAPQGGVVVYAVTAGGILAVDVLPADL